MKTMFSALLAMLLVFTFVGGVMAVPDGGNSMNALCQAKGFDFGIAKWQYGGNGPWEIVDSIGGYDTAVVGDKTLITYSSDPSADGVLTNGDSQVYPGASGSVEKGVNHNGNVEQVTFCGFGDEEVPEFGSLVALSAMGLLGAGLVMWRRS